MSRWYAVYALETGLIREGDDVAEKVVAAAEAAACGGIRDGDILLLAESAVATAEGRTVRLDEVVPSDEARRLAERYAIDPAITEVVLRESDRVVGGIPGFLLTLKNGTLLPNAGADHSNAPDGTVVPLPRDPDASAGRVRAAVRARLGVNTGVLVIDSRTHAMRLGCSGVAIGCAGLSAVVDESGRRDLFGRELEVTKRAVGDCLASAAELLMGEADECVPAVLVRGTGIELNEEYGIPTIDASECLFMGAALHADPAAFDGEGKPE
ncbi:coenzyme F420-0:L-glutamate ligase [Methanofollis formosanus]|uniref:Coenzyme F420-0:L-glutamate ligase n=1 Tax=Methanofollis formosanus TaxID=299308 RepID=A0A8G1A415_9EURY|nr:coenzyme F420-0:L-glutamate ligase [Methanofollis formosanus]QYZ79677.1 coenzyme F420-0:L-glutamate ligase [Methanofollis formosanus]